MTTQYAITLNRTYRPYNSNKSILIRTLKSICKGANLELLNYTFEYGSKNHYLHIHGTLNGPPNLQIFRKGYQIYLKPIYDIDGWKVYISKQQDTKVTKSPSPTPSQGGGESSPKTQ